ncbi:MAG: peptidase domain-containing ABC transporter [Leptolyngbyaceae cyanobacterium bins.302]|nr:peptidase domain-containing ABC transporter [Leptolyngbyaceae cyanobacterium bins.302]
MLHTNLQVDVDWATFFQVFPFNQLSSQQQETIKSKLTVCSFQPGESIYAFDQFPSAVHLITQGRVRVLGSEVDQSPTLAILEAGSLLGWESFLRRVAVGSAQAMISAVEANTVSETSTVTTIALPADDFEALAIRQLIPAFTQLISPVELFDTLSRFLVQSPNYIPKDLIKKVVQYIELHQLACIEHYDPINFKQQSPLKLSADRIWLLSGGEQLNLPIGSYIDEDAQLQWRLPSQFPARLLGIDRAFLTFVLNHQDLPSPSLWTQPQTSQEIQLQSRMDDSEEHEFDSEVMELTPAFNPSSVTSSNNNFYPVWKSSVPDPIEDIVACFGMVCDRLQVPFRPDYLRSWLRRRFEGNTPTHSINELDFFDLYVRLAQAVGLNARIIQFSPTAQGIKRLSTPVLIQCQNVFAVLYEVTPALAIVGSPRTGLLRLKPQELGQRLVNSLPSDRKPVTLSAIAIERLPQTPTKHFGFNWFIPALKSQRQVLIQVLIASVFVQLLGVANPLLIQQVIDGVIVDANPGAMPMFGILMMLCAFFEGILTILRTYLFSSTANRLDLQLGIEIVHHLLRLPMGFFEKRPVGDLAARLNELENIRQFLTGTALTAVLDVVFSVFYLVVMFLYSVQLSLCVLLSVPLVVGSTLVVSTLQQKLIRIKSDHGSKVQAYLVEVLGGIFTVKAQHMESLVEATWRDRYVKYLTSGFKTSTVSTVFYSFSTLINNVSNLFVLWVGAGLVLQGELTLGGLIAFRILTGYVTGPLLRLAGFWQRFQEAALSMELLADIAEAPTEEPILTDAKPQLPEIQGHVQYHEVSFAFQPGQPQLSQLNLEVQPGEFIGVVGQSGSGKSTMVKLLPRLYLPQAGHICIDGYDIGKISLSSLRQQIGIVPQDVLLFEGTIRDNIALFENLSDETVMEAATIAEAHDFIMQLPDGYATRVGERGSSLSGGQRQRIAIARVVARNPQLLIFDEATSALDYETERRVCNNLMQRFHDRTCFFITHRLNTIANADRILVMQSGAIVEQGTHPELMAQRQLYYCLHAQQAAG